MIFEKDSIQHKDPGYHLVSLINHLHFQFVKKSGQATKGTRGMPWRHEAMKDVASCDKLREAAKQAEIRRFPNRETDPGLCPGNRC